MDYDQQTSLQRRARGLFRMMLSGIFIVAGANHLTNTGHIADRLEAAPFGHLATIVAGPEVLVLLTSVPLIVAGIMLLVGAKTRLAALICLATIIPITLSVQIGDISTLGPLFKNIGLAGGLLYFATHGSRVWSIDGWCAGKE